MADALSRLGHLLTSQLLSEVKPFGVQEMVNSNATDSDAQQLMEQLALHGPNEQGFTLHQGLIRKGSAIWVGNNSTTITKLISTFHDFALGRGILPYKEHIQDSRKYFSGKVRKQTLTNLSSSVWCANKPSMKIPTHQVDFSHRPYQKENGKILQWTSLRGCQSMTNMTLYWWWWWTSFPNMPILSLFITL